MQRSVELDDDVMERLVAESQIRGASFRGTLNEVIRDGLAVAAQRRNSATSFRVKPHAIGLKPGLSYHSISTLLEIGEDEGRR